MLRCTIELIPGGNEEKARTIGLVEMALQDVDDGNHGSYKVVLTKTPPFKGALKAAWRKGILKIGHDDQDIIVGGVEGHHRERRGSYDLLYLALKACGLEDRNRKVKISEPELPPLTVRTAFLVLLGAVHTDELTQELVASWTDEQREQAVDWASAAIAEASDNIVDVPPKPDFLPADQPWQGTVPGVSQISDTRTENPAEVNDDIS